MKNTYVRPLNATYPIPSALVTNSRSFEKVFGGKNSMTVECSRPSSRFVVGVEDGEEDEEDEEGAYVGTAYPLPLT